MCRLLDRLGNPHQQLRSVHIAGTKGKGSTAAMTESILRAAGYRTGLFTSPHLHTFRERIRIDGRPIPRGDLIDLLHRCQPALESEPDRTTFEVMTALAFVYFVQSQIEWAVIEVGLGGRLDATNVIHPAACAITAVSLDHTEVLGHTLALIAGEKAGIIKPDVPVVVAPQAEEAMPVIRGAAAAQAARLITVGPTLANESLASEMHPPYTWQWTGTAEAGLAEQRFSLQGPLGTVYADLAIPFLGRHQLANASTAVALAYELQQQGATIPRSAIYAGLRRARWPGRLEVLAQRPWIVVDGAHNADSAHKLRAAIQELFPYRRLGLLFGASADKDIRGMLTALLPATDCCWISASQHPRAAAQSDLASLARSLRPEIDITIAPDVASALAGGAGLGRAR
jgi:dihydrofolate synthase/folylpolyglutamate synthase